MENLLFFFPFLFIIAMEGFDSMMRVASQLIRIVRMILVVLEAVSGLAVNWRKSCIYPIKEVIQIQALANVLGYRIENSQLFT